MSGRIKRHLSKAGTSTADVGVPQSSSAVGRKKRKVEVNSSEDEERPFWTPKHLGDLKAYNRSAIEPPAELFRKDLISAMKLADNEPLTDDDFWGISDQWKQEWERGVQVPVNPDSLPEPSVVQHRDYPKPPGDFRLPRRYIRVTHSDFFNNEKHVLSNVPTKAEKMCRYDMDNLDDAWLLSYNGERARMGAEPVPLHTFELIIEHFEETCGENIHKLLKTEESLSLEFDEDVICDVCRSPDSEEGNEMVFCDTCNICVHQACYGITAIPSGSWLCRTCSLGIKPNCVLCPNKSGAMKSTKSGHKWAHVACALWIPEVSIGSVERMEPITKISTIPHSRWTLVCVLCRERWGACIQCSVKSCKTAYHVTCAFKHGLEMKAIIEDENRDDVKLRSYCEKHSRINKKENSDGDSDGGGGNTHKKKKDMTSEQKNQARAAQLRKIEAEFYKHVNFLQTSTVLDIDEETTETIFNYWKLKRKSVFNKPLLTPRSQESDLLAQQQEQDIERMKMFVQLRQYLERVRNLCYMVSRREKMSRTFFKTREQTFLKQASLLSNPKFCLSSHEKDAVMQANHGPSIYDQMYSHPDAPVHSTKQYDKILKLITGTYKSKSKSRETEPDITEKPKKKYRKDINGIVRSKHHSHSHRHPPPIPPPNHHPPPGFIKESNPYKRPYINGAKQRRSRSKSLSRGTTDTSSAEDSDSSLASTKWKPPDPGSRLSVYTSSEDERLFAKKDASAIRRRFPTFDFTPNAKREIFDTSEDEDAKAKATRTNRKPTTRGRGGRRGRGRPPQNRGCKAGSTPVKERVFSSEEEKTSKMVAIKESKAFDALIKSATKPFTEEALSIKVENDRKAALDSSEEETPPKSKGRGRRKLPIKEESVSSSEDEEAPPPPKPSPSPSKRGRKGRGKTRSRGVTRQVCSRTATPPPASKFSDDDLGPATYKLTSEEDDKSDHSLANEPTVDRRDSSGANNSERTDNSGSEQETPPKSERRKQQQASDHSDANSEASLKDSQSESYNHSHMKTKGAMKEFAPKLEAKMEKITKKADKTDAKAAGKPTKKQTDKFKQEPKASSKQVIDVDSSSKESNSKAFEPEPSHDLSIVPQRAAAKKASELITSQNTGAPAAPAAPAAQLQQGAQEMVENKKPIVRASKESVSEAESIPSSNEEPKKSPLKTRKKSSREKTDEVKGDPSDPPKKNIFEPPEILPYVPIREAARKAAENFKAGGVKAAVAPPTTTTPEEIESLTPPKLKKQIKLESKSLSLRSAKTKSPRSSSKPSSVASDSENEQEAYPSLKKRELPDIKGEKSKSIFSESEDEGLVSPQKERVTPDKGESAKDLPHKQQLFRGDFFIFNHQSSSENEEEKNLASDERRSSGKAVSSKDCDQSKQSQRPKLAEARAHSFRSSRPIRRHFASDEAEEEHEAENEEPTTETRRKAPDKKLKTSDGRPEHGFQPPVTKRNESRVSSSQQPDEISYSLSSPKRPDSVLCESGSQCRSRVASGDFAQKDIAGDPDAPPSPRGPRGKDPPEGTSATKSRLMDSRASKDFIQELCRNARSSEKERGKVQLEEAVPSPAPSPTPKATPEKGFKSTFECISTGQEEKAVEINDIGPIHSSGVGIFNFNEKEVEVKRLEDIEETDPEPGPKNVKIFDSDEENLYSQVEGKVEQPKDSGYKSAIATPEPNEKMQVLTPDNDIKPCITGNQPESHEPLTTSHKKIHPHISPLEGASIPNKYISPGRRKNLDDVIEERKKVIEQSEIMASAFEKQPTAGPQVPSPHHRASMDSIYPDSVEETTDVKEAPDSDGNAENTSNTSRFVAEWRGQWNSPQNSSVPLEHPEPAANFPAQPHHPSLTGLEYQRYLELQQNHYSENFPMYFGFPSLRMMEIAYRYSLRQDNVQHPIHNEQSIRMPTQEQPPRIKIPPPSHVNNTPHEVPSPNRNALLMPEDVRHKGMNFRPNTAGPLADLTAVSSATHDLPPTSIPQPLGNLRTATDSLPSLADRNADSDMLIKKSLTPAKDTSREPPVPSSPIISSSIVSSLIKSEPINSSPVACQNLSVSPSYVKTNKEEAPPAVTEISTAMSQTSSPTSTITTAASKISSIPLVSPGNVSRSPSKTFSPRSCTSDVDSTQVFLTSSSPVPSSTSSNTLSTPVPISTSKAITANAVSSITSPISSVVSPTPSTPKDGISPRNAQQNSVSEGRVLRSPERQPKKIPIYMQEPKTPKPEKRSPRTQAVSPRWTKEKKEKKPKNTRKYNSSKSGRGRGSGKGRGRGGYHSPRFGSASVPKELVGTVYEFDDEFDDDGPANNALVDLRMLRVKRQSVDTTPQQSFTPTYTLEKESLPPKKAKERKTKASHKEKQIKTESVDEVAKIIEDYKNMQNSTLQRSVHEPSPQPEPYSDQKHEAPIESPTSDPLALDEEKDMMVNDASSMVNEERKAAPTSISSENVKGSSDNSTFTTTFSRLPDDSTNQLRLKLKGPYANNYLHNNLSTSQPEVTINPTPPSTTTTLRRMRKKELIMQYCYQDKNTDQPEKNFTANPHNPINSLGITIPKAVASMTTIPTREDYKMYTQDGPNSKIGSSTNRRRRQTRELKQLDWTLLGESKGKRSTESQEGGRKRARFLKEKSQEEKDPSLSAAKIRISIGKKVPEVAQVPQCDTKDLGSKGKPPKKRFPDESMFMKVMNESLKFREEIMANFDKKSNESVKGGSLNEKKSKKRRLALPGEGSSSPSSEVGEDSQDVKVISNESSNKLVLKISKGKSDRGSSDGRSSSGKEDKPGSAESTPNPHPYPLKIRLNLAGLSKSDSAESNPTTAASTEDKGEECPTHDKDGSKIKPLKITFQRGPEGSITYRSSRHEKQTLLDHGPGPPDPSLQPQPPDPTNSPGHHPPYKDMPPPPTKDPPADVSATYNSSQIEHRDREALTRESSQQPPARAPQDAPPPPHSSIPKDVFERLEARFASAADEGGVSMIPLSNSSSAYSSQPSPGLAGTPSSPPSFSTLQAVPALKDDSGCR